MVQYDFSSWQWLIDIVGNPGQLSPVKVKKFSTEASADIFIDDLQFTFLNTLYSALQTMSEMLYSALGDMTETINEQYLPLILYFPGTKLAWKLLDDVGDPYDFRMDDLDIDPVTVCLKLELFGKFYVFYPEISDFEIANSENHYYYIDDVYGLGSSFDPVHKMKLSELTLDGALLAVLAIVTGFLAKIGLESVNQSVTVKAFSGVSSIGLNSRVGQIADDVTAVDGKVDTLSTNVSSVASDVSDIVANIATVITKINELLTTVQDETIITKLNEIKSMLGVRLIIT